MLPTEPRERTEEVTPLQARILLSGTQGVGKTSLLAEWAPETTIIADTHQGTTMLDGKHFVQPVNSWEDFKQLVTDLTTTEHQFTGVGLDLVDDLWNYADKAHAGRGRPLASATDDYQSALNAAIGDFREQIGKLIASNLGVWFISHVSEVKDGEMTRYRSALGNKKVLGYVLGVAQFAWLAEAMGPQRVIHTQPSARFEAKSRRPVPAVLPMDARVVYREIANGLKLGAVARELAEVPDVTSEPEPEAPVAA